VRGREEIGGGAEGEKLCGECLMREEGSTVFSFPNQKRWGDGVETWVGIMCLGEKFSEGQLLGGGKRRSNFYLAVVLLGGKRKFKRQRGALAWVKGGQKKTATSAREKGGGFLGAIWVGERESKGEGTRYHFLGVFRGVM